MIQIVKGLVDQLWEALGSQWALWGTPGSSAALGPQGRPGAARAAPGEGGSQVVPKWLPKITENQKVPPKTTHGKISSKL